MERKAKTCPDCEKDFYPYTTIEKRCIPCAIVVANKKIKKKYDQETRRLKRGLKLRDKPYQLGLAQQWFNAYIRARDAGQPCISCLKNSGAKMNAGHYLSVGAHPELRFNENNCHLQCEHCNSFLSGNIARYRINLIEKIGLEEVEKLEGPQNPLNLTIDDVIEIKKKYQAKTKELTA